MIDPSFVFVDPPTWSVGITSWRGVMIVFRSREVTGLVIWASCNVLALLAWLFNRYFYLLWWSTWR